MNSVYETHKRRAYSAKQLTEFVADTGKPEYADIVGWPE